MLTHDDGRKQIAINHPSDMGDLIITEKYSKISSSSLDDALYYYYYNRKYIGIYNAPLVNIIMDRHNVILSTKSR